MSNLKYKCNADRTERLSRLVAELTSLYGVSTDEHRISAALKQGLLAFCDAVETDKTGNVTGHIFSDSKAKNLMLEAHMDRIGLIISGIEKDGSLKFESVGGVDCRILPAAEVVILGKEQVNGIVFRAKHDKDKNTQIKNMRIDTGLSAENVKKFISVGDMAVFKGNAIRLCGNKMSGAAMDNRAGIAAILESLRRIDRGKLKYNISVLFSVQEELGLHGAYTGTYSLNPDAAIAVDVTHGSTPDSENETGVFPLGSGAVICRGPNFHYEYTKQLLELAENIDIPHTIEVASGPSGTTAWAIQITNSGIPVMLVSIPLRYMHTNVETLDIKDIDAISELIKTAAEGGIRLD